MGPPDGAGGGGMGAAPTAAAPAQSSFGSGAGPAATPSTGGGGASGLYGLRPSGDGRVLTLKDALGRAAEQNWDLRVAKERIAQQETQVRRAYAALLPQVSMNGSYTYNCQIGKTDQLIDCADQTIQFTSKEQLDQQALLFRSIGNVVEGAAEFEQDPERQQEQREQARQLYSAADDIEDTDIEPVVVAPAHVVGGSLNVSVPLFNGRAIPLLMNAYTAVDAVRLGTYQSRSALLYATARGYYGAVTAKKFVKIAEEQKASAIRHRDATKAQVELETQARLALRRAELDVIRAEQQVRAAKAAYISAVAQVGTLIGEVDMFDVEDPGAPSDIETSGDADTLVATALTSRDDLRAQKLAVVIADRGRVDAWMQFLPTVSLVGRASATSNVSGFVGAPVSSALILQASVPIYDGGARYATLRESGSRVREELLKVKQLEAKIEAQVRGNIAEIAQKKDSLSLARQALDLSRASQEQAQAMFEVGMGTPLDVTDTNLAVFLSEVDVARAELELDQARLGLAYMLGYFPGEQPDPLSIESGEVDSARKRLDGVDEEAGGQPPKAIAQ